MRSDFCLDAFRFFFKHWTELVCINTPSPEERAESLGKDYYINNVLLIAPHEGRHRGRNTTQNRAGYSSETQGTRERLNTRGL